MKRTSLPFAYCNLKKRKKEIIKNPYVDIPNEIYFMIFKYLPHKDLINSRFICRFFRNIADQFLVYCIVLKTKTDYLIKKKTFPVYLQLKFDFQCKRYYDWIDKAISSYSDRIFKLSIRLPCRKDKSVYIPKNVNKLSLFIHNRGYLKTTVILNNSKCYISITNLFNQSYCSQNPIKLSKDICLKNLKIKKGSILSNDYFTPISGLTNLFLKQVTINSGSLMALTEPLNLKLSLCILHINDPIPFPLSIQQLTLNYLDISISDKTFYGIMLKSFHNLKELHILKMYQIVKIEFPPNLEIINIKTPYDEKHISKFTHKITYSSLEIPQYVRRLRIDGAILCDYDRPLNCLEYIRMTIRYKLGYCFPLKNPKIIMDVSGQSEQYINFISAHFLHFQFIENISCY